MAGRPKMRADLVKLQDKEEEVLEALEQGIGVETLAEKWGITRSAMNAFVEAPERSEAVARARVRAADHLAQQALVIADDTTGEVARDRLRVDTRKWLAAKWNPAMYGDTKNPTVQINLGELHLAAVKAIKPDSVTIDVVDESSNER